MATPTSKPKESLVGLEVLVLLVERVTMQKEVRVTPTFQKILGITDKCIETADYSDPAFVDNISSIESIHEINEGRVGRLLYRNLGVIPAMKKECYLGDEEIERVRKQGVFY